jgi:hypothetical protein
MRTLWFLLAASLLTGAAPKLNLPAVTAMEKSFDRRLEREVLDGDPFLLLGLTRGIYVDGFGIVYSAEVNLAQGPGISPFHPEVTKEDVARLKQKKVARLPLLKKAMKQQLLDAAGSLDGLPAEEHLVLGVTLFRHSWEDTSGLPHQIVMQAQKRALVDIQTGRRDRTQLDTVIRMQEF